VKFFHPLEPRLHFSNQPLSGGNWTSIFDDEFNGTSLAAPWEPHQYWNTTSTVVGGGELEAYTPDAVTVSGGALHLTATPATPAQQAQYGEPYVSGLVETGGENFNNSAPKFSFLFGYMEVSAQLPVGQGFWPAIWMMPASYHDGNGELDVMENLGGTPNIDYMTVHRHGSQQFSLNNLSPGFHTYGVDWEPDHITWYVDGAAVATCTNTALICPEAAYPILNLAVGGNWGGPPNASTIFPASMDVDYVRIWRQAAPAPLPTISSTPLIAGPGDGVVWPALSPVISGPGDGVISPVLDSSPVVNGSGDGVISTTVATILSAQATTSAGNPAPHHRPSRPHSTD
jgi:beta-glucanase (GH16 family)